jgi:hypothetical protein
VLVSAGLASSSPCRSARADSSLEARRGDRRALELHEGIAHTRRGCDRWPKNLRLAATGRLVPGRCRATNKCRYCAALYAVETIEALTLDALGGDAPGLWVVLTAREHLTRPEFNEHLRVIRQAMRRQGWEWEHFVSVEFQKRGALHANLLVKLRGGNAEAFFAELSRRWCERVDAEQPGQWADAVLEEKGGAYAATRYVSKALGHGLKGEQHEQAAPIGWSGHRTSHTRGYFGRPMWQVRRDAHASLQRKRELHKAEREGYTPVEADAVADARILRDGQVRWELVAVTVDGNGELQRVRPAGGGGVVSAMRSGAPAELRRARSENAGRALRALDELEAGGGVALAVTGRDPVPHAEPPPLFTMPAHRERF